MTGTLSPDIVNKFKARFESDCIDLLFDGYRSLHATGRNFLEDSENDITAQLVGEMKRNPKRFDLQISVEREHYIDSDRIYEGIDTADSSPRIDIIYTTWNSKSEYSYHVEAKLLAENNWKKGPSQIAVRAESLQKRYIETGIDNFCSGKYKNGSIIGYVLEGEIPNIVVKLNKLLTDDKRAMENLSSVHNPSHTDCYVSDHAKVPISLNHFFFHFMPLVTAN